MSRQVKAPALVLKMNPVGENHRGLFMLVAGEGLLRALAFGAQGRRNSLRATAVPYNTGLANLHFDGARDRWRLTAFDPEGSTDGLREDLNRFYTATAWAEILLKSHGSGGDSVQLYHLAANSLSLLSRISGKDVRKLNTGFLWHFLSIEGVKPDAMRCGRCGKILPVDMNGDSALFWPDGLLVGPECAESKGRKISDGARAWLQRISGSIEDSLRIELEYSNLPAVEEWVVCIVQRLLEYQLKVISQYPRGFRSLIG